MSVDLHRELEMLRTAHGVPDIVAALARDGSIVQERATGPDAAPGTIFGIGSCTKSFTAIAVLQLQEAGRLSVADPLVAHIPEFRLRDRGWANAITIHHLLTHTSGLPPLPSRGMALGLREGPPLHTHDQHVAFLAEAEIAALGPPGRYFSYSNDGFWLLGGVIARLSGMPYARYVTEMILRPAGMVRTAFGMDGLPEREIAPLYARGEGGVVAAPGWEDAPVLDPGGGLKSTAGDLIRYLEIFRTDGMVAGRRLLHPASVAAMLTPHARLADHGHPALPAERAYGYGLMIETDPRGFRYIAHGGGKKGVTAHIAVVPELGVSGAMLCNLAAVPTAPALRRLVLETAGVPAEPPRPPRATAPARPLVAYAGTYCSGEGATVAVAMAGDGLSMQVGKRNLRLAPVGDDTFCAPDGDQPEYTRFLFEDGEHGEAWAMNIGTRLARRLPAGAGG